MPSNVIPTESAKTALVSAIKGLIAERRRCRAVQRLLDAYHLIFERACLMQADTNQADEAQDLLVTGEMVRSKIHSLLEDSIRA